MPICPNCKTEQIQRRGGCCPNCLVSVKLIDGEWYIADDGSPNVALVSVLEQLYSERQSNWRNMQINYQIPRRGVAWKLELRAAANLLKMTDNDLGLAKETLLLLFDDPQFNWKLYTSLMSIYRDFIIALAIVKARRAKVEKDTARQEKYLDELGKRRYIFS